MLTDFPLFCLQNSKSRINFAASKEEAEQIYVFYAEEASVGIKTMRKYVLLPTTFHAQSFDR